MYYKNEYNFHGFYAECKRCQKTFTHLKSFNLKRHLERVHQVVFPRRKNNVQQQFELNQNQNNYQYSQIVELRNNPNASSVIKHLSDSFAYNMKIKSITSMLLQTGISLAFTSHPAFQEMIQALDPSMPFTSCRNFQKISSCLITNLEQRVVETLKTSNHIFLTLEGWVCPTTSIKYLGISVILYSKPLNKNLHLILNLFNLSNMTSTRLREMLDETLQNWGISKSAIIGLISDYGKNIISICQASYKIPFCDIKSNPEERPDEATTIKMEEDDWADEKEDYLSEEDLNREDIKLLFMKATSCDDLLSESDLKSIKSCLTPTLQHFPCPAHSMRQLIRDLFHVDQDHTGSLILSTIKKAREFVKTIKFCQIRLPVSNDFFLDTPTNLNSTKTMLSSIINNKSHLSEISATFSLNNLHCMNSTLGMKSIDLELITLAFPYLDAIIGVENKLNDPLTKLSELIPILMEFKSEIEDLNETGSIEQKNIGVAILTILGTKYSWAMDSTNTNFSPLPASATLLNDIYQRYLLTLELKDLKLAAISYVSKLVPPKLGSINFTQTEMNSSFFKKARFDTSLEIGITEKLDPVKLTTLKSDLEAVYCAPMQIERVFSNETGTSSFLNQKMLDIQEQNLINRIFFLVNHKKFI